MNWPKYFKELDDMIADCDALIAWQKLPQIVAEAKKMKLELEAARNIAKRMQASIN